MSEEAGTPTPTPTSTPTAAPDNDVVSLLMQQHQRIRELCNAVVSAEPSGRDEPFQELLRLMAVHEAVEEEIVHPYVRRRVKGAATMVDDRLHEEEEGKRLLVALDALGPRSPVFMPVFEHFKSSMLAHADKEERSEFTGLREQTRPGERVAMGAAVKVATMLAPTHPHPGLESAARSVLIGTPLAMIDRARDLIRQAMTTKAKPDGEPSESADATDTPQTAPDRSATPPGSVAPD